MNSYETLSALLSRNTTALLRNVTCTLLAGLVRCTVSVVTLTDEHTKGEINCEETWHSYLETNSKHNLKHKAQIELEPVSQQ